MLENASTSIVVILVIIALVSVVKNVSDMISSWRRNPSLDKDLQDYMPRQEIGRKFTALEKQTLDSCAAQHRLVDAKFNELKDEDNRLWTKLNGMDRTNNKNQQDIQRTLGRIEGKLEDLSQK
jgi:hypothetical protein